MSQEIKASARAPIAVLLLSLIIAAGGIFLTVFGARLVSLGGSFYFVLTGLALVATAGLLARRNALGLWLYVATFAATVIWSLFDAGLNFWPLVSRLAAPGVILMLVFLAAPTLTRGRTLPTSLALTGAGLSALALLAMGVRVFQQVPFITNDVTPEKIAEGGELNGNWPHYGGSLKGTRYTGKSSITPENVAQLELAWTFRHGHLPVHGHAAGAEDQNTPTVIDGIVYTCNTKSQLFALDADTGEQLWKFDPEAKAPFWERCRGVGYYESNGQPSPELQRVKREAAGFTTTATFTVSDDNAPAMPAVVVPEGLCAKRVVLPTIDARIIQLDAKTGELCPQFGTNGQIDLKEHMGEVKPAFYMPTSAPTIADGIIIQGGWVVDNVTTNVPPGVIRGFDAETGELIWAWDLGRPETKRFPPEGESYTRGTPNAWAGLAVDQDLGYVYLPLGNATPDFFGGHRRPFDDEFNASVVALDYRTGEYKWHFRTMNHDIWDYDLPSQPALYDLPDGKGGVQKALVQLTKRGQIFVLDRETGRPIFDVEEKAVPQGAVGGDWTAATQPYSTGMPTIGAERLTEAKMWGATPFDALMCRIEFLSYDYEGDFTPPSEKGAIMWPGFAGGMNWGSASIQEETGYLVFTESRAAHVIKMVGREEADKADAKDSHAGLSSQFGTPWGAAKWYLMSPLGVPCQEPPFGTMTAIDLKTQQVAWQMPLGTVEHMGPLNIPTRLPIPIGMPGTGGAVTTQSGLVFYGGTMDKYIRAFDLKTGQEVWKHEVPVGIQATPSVYVSPKTGREYVVVTAGGTRTSQERGDYVMAFALPQ